MGRLAEVIGGGEFGQEHHRRGAASHGGAYCVPHIRSGTTTTGALGFVLLQENLYWIDYSILRRWGLQSSHIIEYICPNVHWLVGSPCDPDVAIQLTEGTKPAASPN